MEIIKTRITITEFKDTSSIRTVFETLNHGKMSAFRNEGETLIDDLKAHNNCLISVGISKTEKEGKTYQNIKEFYGKVVEQNGVTAIKEVIQPDKQSKQFAGAPIAEDIETVETKGYIRKEFDKDPVGLAVEIYCALLNCAAKTDSIENVMEHAIMMVKQAHKGFS